MQAARVKFTYRKIIDDSSTGTFERTVLTQSYSEFAVKCQEYNPGVKHFSLAAMIAENPKANSLHYKCALAVSDTIKGLRNVIPDVKDTFDNESLAFERYEFTILEADPFNIASCKLAITFYTGDYLMPATVGEYLLLSDMKNLQSTEELCPTFMIKLSPGLAVSAYNA